jgi:ArsR family transcriptional regulator, cadmium/lead-responsive transcriptional repressor
MVEPMLITTNAQALTLKAKLLRGLSDPSRLAILEALRNGSLTVTAIVEATGLSQPNTSNHLSCLYDCGLVSREQEGRYVRYGLSDARIATLLVLTEEILADVAKGVYECTRYNIAEEREHGK